MAVNADGGAVYSTSLTGLIVLGFIAAVGVGSIAWYNSKRPVGWEDKERPDIVPNVEKTENPGV
ncbi:MAG: hypothetical protein AAF915_05915 [Cyanobacteria bacterium P01_D01_bin.50]